MQISIISLYLSSSREAAIASTPEECIPLPTPRYVWKQVLSSLHNAHNALSFSRLSKATLDIGMGKRGCHIYDLS